MTIGQTASKTKAALAAAIVLALPTLAWAGAADTYYERAFVVAADARCNLFAPAIDAALNAATAQAPDLADTVIREAAVMRAIIVIWLGTSRAASAKGIGVAPMPAATAHA